MRERLLELSRDSTPTQPRKRVHLRTTTPRLNIRSNIPISLKPRRTTPYPRKFTWRPTPFRPAYRYTLASQAATGAQEVHSSSPLR